MRIKLMSKIEDLLAPGSIEKPDYLCGTKMQLMKSGPMDKASGTDVRIYECPTCKHQLRLMVWLEEELASITV